MRNISTKLAYNEQVSNDELPSFTKQRMLEQDQEVFQLSSTHMAVPIAVWNQVQTHLQALTEELDYFRTKMAIENVCASGDDGEQQTSSLKISSNDDNDSVSEDIVNQSYWKEVSDFEDEEHVIQLLGSCPNPSILNSVNAFESIVKGLDDTHCQTYDHTNMIASPIDVVVSENLMCNIDSGNPSPMELAALSEQKQSAGIHTTMEEHLKLSATLSELPLPKTFLLVQGKRLFHVVIAIIRAAETERTSDQLVGLDDGDGDQYSKVPSLAGVCDAIEDLMMLVNRFNKCEQEYAFLDMILHRVLLHDEFIRPGTVLQYPEDTAVTRAVRLYDTWKERQDSLIALLWNATKNSALTSSLCKSLSSLGVASSLAFESSSATLGDIVKTLDSVMKSCFEGSAYRFIALAVLGSSANTLFLPTTSDLDLTILIEGTSSAPSEAKNFAIAVLSMAMDALSKESNLYVVKELVTQAKVPVLKLLHDGRDIDISVNQVHGVCNTALLRRYVALDDRVRSLILAVKQWAKNRGLNNPRNSTLSSYAWTILVVHFLQRTNPPVLPVVHLSEECEDIMAAETIDLGRIGALLLSEDDMFIAVKWSSRNLLSVGELLLMFYHYYSCVYAEGFDIFRHVCSIRELGVRLKTECADVVHNSDHNSSLNNDPSTASTTQAHSYNWRISIEDPVDATVDLGRVIHRFEGQQLIVEEIRRAIMLLISWNETEEDGNNVFASLCTPNTSVPSMPFQCFQCGSAQHQSSDCPDLVCNHCHGCGHLARNCSVPRICYKCRGPHRTRDCPNKITHKPIQKSWRDIVNAADKLNIVDDSKESGVEACDPSEKLLMELLDEETSATTGDGEEFIREVLSWQGIQILDKQLLTARLSTIPLVFDSVKNWYGTFYPFVLEESRMQLQQALDKNIAGLRKFKVSFSLPPGVLTSLQSGNKGLFDAYLIFPREVDEKAIAGSTKFSFNLCIKNGSPFPEDALAMAEQLKSSTHCLVALRYTVYPRKANARPPSRLEADLIKANPGCVIFLSQALASSPLGKDFASRGTDLLSSDWYIMLMGVGFIAPTRICNALHFSRGAPSLMPDVISGSNILVDNDGSRDRLKTTAERMKVQHALEQIRAFCSNLNHSQKGAIYKVLQVAVDHDVFSQEIGGGYDQPACLQIIKGPPGTGKTATLVALLRSLIECKLTVHAAAPTNVAICELARRVLIATKILSRICSSDCYVPPAESSGSVSADHSDYGEDEKHDTSKEDAHISGMELRLADFLLVGDAARFKLEDDPENSLHEILMDDRIARIQDNYDDMALNISNFLTAIRMHKSRSMHASSEDVSPYEDFGEASDGTSRGKALKLTVAKLCNQMEIMTNEAPLYVISGLMHRDKVYLLALLSSAVDFSESAFELWCQNASVELNRQLEALTLQCTQISKRKSSSKTSHDMEVLTELTSKAAAYAEALRLQKVLQDASSFIGRIKVKPLPKNLKESLLRQASIVFSSVNVSGRTEFHSVHFDVALIDEATQLVQAETAIALQMNGLRCLVLVGDDKQLPATVMSKVCRELGYEMSLFSRLLRLDYPYSLLNIQYRMHPEISRWPKIEFYDGHVQDGENVHSTKYNRDWFSLIPPYCVYDIKAGYEEKNHLGSTYNEAEAALVRKLLFQIRGLKCGVSVGIISPYSAQVDLLKHLETPTQSAATSSSGAGSSSEVTVRVCTVDGFQGQECDIIIFTAVRSNNRSVIGFLQDKRRLNVAATRARYSFVLICNSYTVSTANPTWERLIDNARLREVLFDATNNRIIAETSKKVAQAEDRYTSFKTSAATELFENSPWKIIFSDDFQKSNARCKSSTQVRMLLNKGLIRLAQGEWPRYMIHSNAVSVQYRDVIHVYKVLQYFLVWSVDVNHSTGVQYLRIWNFVLDAELVSAIARVETVLQTYTPEYIRRCSEKKYVQHHVVHPKTWLPGDGDADFVWKLTPSQMKSSSLSTNANSDIDVSLIDNTTRENRQVNDAAVLTKFHDLTSSIVKLFTSERESHSDIANIELPFVMSAQEDKIVRDPKSLIILGRSGTGKTTVILHRMYMRDLRWKMADKKEFQPMTEDEDLIGNVSDVLIPDISNGKSNAHLGIRGQMLVTSSPILCQEIRKSYNNMQRTVRQLEEQRGDAGGIEVTQQEGMINIINSASEVAAVTTSTVDSFMDCSIEDYPLIITFAHFLFMLDKTLKSDSFFEKFKSAASSSPPREVNFHCFSVFYFSQFDQSKVVGDAALLFTEIMSYIKGSLQSLYSARGYMSREDYLQLAEKRDSTLSREERANIYDLFERYEKMKAQEYTGDFDLLDVVVHIYRTLTMHPHLFPDQFLVRYVYIDEVQDLVPAQIALFKFVCKNLQGFVFAGDTAQTIAHGVGFRFSALKDIFYHEFIGIPSGLATTTVASADQDLIREIMPNIWQLSENFRTHCGVVNLANSIVELILEFFPSSIDRLAPETSSIEGPRPIFLVSNNTGAGIDNVLTELFQKGDTHDACEFSAKQVILVRDEKTKQEVTKISERRAIVLTVQESKGMEYDDCLVYNFFESSPLGKDWRALYAVVDPSVPHPSFSPQQHSQLCIELKLLYVLLTRAKQHLIIFDKNVNVREPMLRHWAKKDLVVLKPLDESIRSMFLTPTSSAEDWQQQGMQFLQRKQFWNAKLCFQRARDEFNIQLCSAAEMEHDAEKVSVQSMPKAKEMYSKAATMYLALFDGFRTNAAGCYEKAQLFKLAANLYSEIPEHVNAARCYEMVNMWGKAMHEYASLNDVSNAVRCGYIGLEYSWVIVHLEKFFNDGAISSERERNQMVQECAKKAAIHYHATGNVPKMIEFVLRFSTIEDRRRFLRRYGHLDQLLTIEVSDMNYFEAGIICADMRDYQAALKWFELAGRGLEAARCILQLVKARNLDSRFMVGRLSADDLALLERGRSLLAADGSRSRDEAADFYVRVEIEMIVLFCKGQSLDELMEQVQQKILRVPLGGALRLMLMLIRYKIQQIEPLFNESLASATDSRQNLPGGLRLRSQNERAASTTATAASNENTKEKSMKLKNVFHMFRKVLQDDLLPPLDSMVRVSPPSTSSSYASTKSTPLQGRVTTAAASNSSMEHGRASSSSFISSSANSHKLQQCLAFFELRYPDNANASLITPTKVVVGIASSPAMGLVSTFKLKANEQNEVKSTVQEVAQLGSKFFREELLKIIGFMMNHLETRLRLLTPTDTFSERASRMLIAPSKRPAVATNTAERLEVLVEQYELISLLTTPSAAAKPTSLTKLTVGEAVSNILLPPFLLPEHSSELQGIRQDLVAVSSTEQKTLHTARSIMKEYLSNLRAGTNYDLIGRALLLAELTGDIIPTAERIRRVLASEFFRKQQSRNSKSSTPTKFWEDEANAQLTKAFFSEATDDEDPQLKKTWRHGSFFFSLMSGASSLIDCNVFRKIEISLDLHRSLDKSGAFSPVTYMKLVEKYLVLTLLHNKKYRKVKLPLSLANECLCRTNKAYADVIRRYKLPEYSKSYNQDLSDIYHMSKGKLHDLTQCLMRIIETLTASHFEHWVQESGDRNLQPPATIQGDRNDRFKDLRNAFLSRACVAVLTWVINQPDNDKIIAQYCSRLSAVVLSKEATKAMKHIPHYLHAFVSKLSPKMILSQCHEFSKTYNQDEIVIVSCTSSVFSERASYMNRQLIIELDGDKVQLIPLQQSKPARILTKVTAATSLTPTAAAPTINVPTDNIEEDDGEPLPMSAASGGDLLDSSLAAAVMPWWKGKMPLQDRVELCLKRIHAALLLKVEKVKRTVASLVPGDIMLRLIEKEFLSAGFRCRWSPAVDVIHSALTPLFLLVQKLIGQLDSLISTLTKAADKKLTHQRLAEANENIDLALDARALLDPVLESLLPSACIATMVEQLCSRTNNSDCDASAQVGDDSHTALAIGKDEEELLSGAGIESSLKMSSKLSAASTGCAPDALLSSPAETEQCVMSVTADIKITVIAALGRFNDLVGKVNKTFSGLPVCVTCTTAHCYADGCEESGVTTVRTQQCSTRKKYQASRQYNARNSSASIRLDSIEAEEDEIMARADALN